MPKIEWLLALALLPAVRTSAAPPAIPVPLAEAPVTNAGLPARWNTLPPARQHEVRARNMAWIRNVNVACELQDEKNPIMIGPGGERMFMQ